MSKRSELIIPVGIKPKAAILILENEFLLCAHAQDGTVESKYISPGSVRQDFAAEPIV